MLEEETGRKPTGVDIGDKKVRVRCQDEKQRYAIKQKNDRQRLQGGASITVSPAIVELTAREINSCVVRW